MNVTVHADAHRDGWLSVESDSWLAERSGIVDDLTGSLRTYLEQGDTPDGHASTAAVLAWVAHRWPGSGTSGLYRDGPACEVNLVNGGDTLLVDDIGYVFFVVETRDGEHDWLLVSRAITWAATWRPRLPHHGQRRRVAAGLHQRIRRMRRRAWLVHRRHRAHVPRRGQRPPAGPDRRPGTRSVRRHRPRLLRLPESVRPSIQNTAW